MISKLLAEGNKIDIRDILSPKEEKEGKKPNVYVSQLFDFTEDGNLKVAMPVLRGRLIPLSKGQLYDAFFYSSKGLYQSRILIVDRYKAGNIYTMEIKLTTELQKYQRRQYFRLEKTLSISYIELAEMDYDKIISTKMFPEHLKDMDIYSPGTTLDISGGGMRMVGKKLIKKGHKILVIFSIILGDKEIKFRLPATVIMSFEVQDFQNRYEHRIEFLNISQNYREMLIRYIFEEERKKRSLKNS